MHTTIRTIAIALILQIGAGIAVAAEPSAAMKQVVEAARKEGRLDLQWGSGVMGGDEGLAQLTKAMNAAYGTNISVRFTPGGSFPQMGQSIVVSQQAKLDAPTDVYISTNQQIVNLMPNKAFHAVPWTELMPGRVDAAMVEGEGTAVRYSTVIPGSIIYNTKLAPAKPVRLTDLLAPEWKGKIAATPYAAAFELMSANGIWGEKGLEFARALSQHAGGLIRCNELERIASGEFLALAMDCTGRDWVALEKRGAPIGQVVPADFPALRYYYLMVPANAPHPNTAKLFIATILSPEGQEIIWRTGAVDLHTYPNSGMRKIIAEYEAQGVKFHVFDVAWWLAHPETHEVNRQAVQILSRK